MWRIEGAVRAKKIRQDGVAEFISVSLNLAFVFPAEVKGGQLRIREEATVLHLRLILPLSNAWRTRTDRRIRRVIPMLAEPTFTERFPADIDEFHNRPSRAPLTLP